MSKIDVLIVGAGPTGLVLALWLTRQGASVRIIDKTEGPGTTSRALAVQARTLELYSQLDLSEAVIAGGHIVPAVGLWVEGKRQAQLNFADIGTGMTPYPFLHIFPQDAHEKLLVEKLASLGVTVERQTELISYSEDGAGVVARLKGPKGEERIEAAYIAGCDGARSLVRQTMAVSFPGGTYSHIFYVADVEAAGPAVNGDLAVDLDEADFLAIFPLKGEGNVRLVGSVRDDKAGHADTLKFSDVSDQAIEKLKLEVRHVNWFSTYHVHHRVAAHFRKTRAFLLGDAAHIHSPVGGQGMNTGIGDAINLAWKLKMVLDGKAPDALLNSYEAERLPFAQRLVHTTDRAFSLVTAEGPLADFIRTKIFPVVMPAAVHVEAFRDWMFRTVSQVLINYRGSSISLGAAGAVHGGDRLPYVKTDAGDNYASLKAMRWQVHAYGRVAEGLEAWCDAHHVPLTVFGFTPAHGEAGLKRDAFYLMRPDSYVALAASDPTELARYFSDRKMKP